MKLAVINDEVSQHLDEAVNLAVETGFDGLEIRSVDNTPPHHLSREQCARISNALAAAGLQVCGLAPPVFKVPPPADAAAVRSAAEQLTRSIEIATWLSSPRIRIFTFFREGDPDPVRAAAMARRALAMVDLPANMELCVETGTRTNTPDATTMATFLAELDDPRVGVLWDPGNGVFSGYAGPLDSEYALLRPLIRHVHVKDPRGQQEYVRLGAGDVPWPEVLNWLREDNFAGFVSLETHWRVDRVLDAQQRDEPWGDAFSAGGQDASRQCMEILAAWRREVMIPRAAS